MIPRPERAELRGPPFERSRGYEVRVRARQPATLFDAIQVVVVSVPVADRPRGPLLEDAPQVLCGQLQIAAVGADTGRHALKHLRHDLFESRENVGAAQT
jgi:hypothetical protein